MQGSGMPAGRFAPSSLLKHHLRPKGRTRKAAPRPSRPSQEDVDQWMTDFAVGAFEQGYRIKGREAEAACRAAINASRTQARVAFDRLAPPSGGGGESMTDGLRLLHLGTQFTRDGAFNLLALTGALTAHVISNECSRINSPAPSDRKAACPPLPDQHSKHLEDGPVRRAAAACVSDSSGSEVGGLGGGRGDFVAAP